MTKPGMGTCALAIVFMGWGAMAGCTKRGTYKPTEEKQSQWSQGVLLWSGNCAGCHGDDGEGDEQNPKLAGDGALPEEPRAGSERNIKLVTAADLFQFAKTSMPPMSPGSLSDPEYWAVVNYVLKQANIKAPETVTAGNAATIKLHP